MDAFEDEYKLGCVLRSENKAPFPIGWLTFSIVLIVLLVIVLYFFFRQRTQLVEPSTVPTIRARYAVVPNIVKDPSKSCGSSGQDECTFPANTLTKAVELCELHHKICTEFAYDPVSGTMNITDPGGTRRSSQQGNLYLQQVGSIVQP